MNTQTTITALSVAIQAREAVLLIGPPGSGKTANIGGIGRALDWWTETVIASLREPSDFGGLPAIIDSEVRLIPPSWAIRLSKEKNGICFIDEISTCAPAVQAALLRVILDRVVGDLHLGDGIAMVAAMNPPEQAAGGWDLAAPLANRFCHLQWSLDAQSWCQGIESGFQPPSVAILPPNWKVGLSQQQALVSAYIRHNPTALLEVPKEESKAGEAWASPRSWDMATRLLTACTALGTTQDVKGALVSGCVGAGAAIQLFNYLKELDLPDPEECLRHPEKVVLPKRTDQRYALFNSIAAVVVANMTPDRYERAFKVMYKAVEANAPDVAFSAVQNLIRNEPDGMRSQPKEMVGWFKLLKDAGIVGGGRILQG